MEKTTLSEKGQIVIPKAVRLAHGWEPGMEIMIEDLGDGVLLKPLRPYQATVIEDVLGCVVYKGPRKSLNLARHAGCHRSRRGGKGMIAVDTNVLVRFLTGDDPA